MSSRLANPVLMQELRGRMRGARAFIILTIYLIVLAGVVTLIYLATASQAQFDPFNAGRTIGKALFIGTAAIALIQVMLIVPSQAANAIASEKERQTYDLLILTLLPPWKIVVGKLMAALAYGLLLIIAVIPFMALSFFFGGVTGLEVVLALVGLLVTAIMFGSIGIFWSTVMRRSMSATITTAAVSVALLLGIPFLAGVFAAVVFGNGFPPPRWTGSPFFIYPWTMFVSLHPFIALGTTDAYLSAGEVLPVFPVDQNPVPVYLPTTGPFTDSFPVLHPWLLFTIEGLLVSALLIFLSVRMLKPLNEGPPKKKRAARGKR
jgi:ABC-type transport system involved in multi-copper enzyme maturation permease subunit